MTTSHYKTLFKQLDDFIGIKPPSEIDRRCCEKPRIRTDGIHDTCVNCGTMNPYNEIIIKKHFLNPKYQLSTCIGYNNKFKPVLRLHKWINYDYRENMANRNYNEIREIGSKLKLDPWVLDNACMIYKKIYIDDNISSRNKIKKSLFIYCLSKSCYNYNIDFDIIKTLKDNKLSIKNYNKSLLKIKDVSKLFLNPNMVLLYKKLKDNFDTQIKAMDIIIEYNKNCNMGRNKKRLNNNSILIGSIYNLLNLDCDKKFYKTFNITKTTINKFIRLINKDDGN